MRCMKFRSRFCRCRICPSRARAQARWTVSKAGTNRNVIPAEATAQADARALRVEDFGALEKAMREKISQKLLPASKVELKFEVRRPPLEANAVAVKLAKHAQGIYDKELQLPMKVMDKATGSGTG